MSINSIILETAVRNFIPHIENHDSKNVHWKELTETKLLEELVLCLLSSSVKYEVAASYVAYFIEAGFFKSWILNVPKQNELYSILNTPILVKSRYIRYRFPKQKSLQLHSMIVNIYGRGASIMQILNKCKNPKLIRVKLVEICSGIGNKQSSMFLRNIGFTNKLAILDTHLIDYLKTLQIIPANYTLNTSKKYLLVEDKYLNYAVSKNFNMSHLDSAIWSIMKVYKKEFAI
jgi:N-glycosylase/DNA lyase